VGGNHISTNHRLVEPVVRDRPLSGELTPLHFLVFVSVALGTLIGGTTFIFGGQGAQFQKYLSLLIFYGIASGVFVASRIRRTRLQLFELPVYITVMFFLQFGLAPLYNFLDPSQIEPNLSADGQELVQALAYVIVGMAAYWVGCGLFRTKERDRGFAGLRSQAVESEGKRGRMLLPLGIVFAISLATNVYLLKNHLYGYLSSADQYSDNLASMQVMNTLATFGTLALIIVAIEKYRDPLDPVWRILFFVVLASQLLWGLISGMKSSFLQNFLVLAMVSSFVMKKLNLRWFLVLFFGLVLIYPINTAYRAIVVEERGGVTSLGGAANAGQLAWHRLGLNESNTTDVLGEGMQRTLQRLDLLTSVAEMFTLGSRASFVKGNLNWWMLPVYPFIPRFIWPSKPILDEGGRFDLALIRDSMLSGSASSCTAVTYPGDLYLRFGLLGIVGGMFVFGIITQWVANRVKGEVESRELFIYAGIFNIGFWYETDGFSMWTGFIKLLVILYILRALIYGPRKAVAELRQSPRRKRAIG